MCFFWMLNSTKAKSFYARFRRNVLSLFNFQFLYPRVKLYIKLYINESHAILFLPGTTFLHVHTYILYLVTVSS